MPCNFDRSQSLEVLTLNLPGLVGDNNLRIPLTALNKRFILKDESWDAIFQVLAWSFGILATGTMPSVDHIGRPMTGVRLKWAGKPVPKAVLAEVRGDWAFYKSIFRFPQHNETAGICWRCNATPSSFREVGADAAWRQNTLSHFDLISRQLDLGLQPSALFASPCLRSDCFLVDWLHCADHGIAPQFLASLFRYVMPKFAGRTQEERCRNLFLDMKSFYAETKTESRLDHLSLSMLGASSKPPVLRSKAAEARALVPYGLLLARRLLSDQDPLENTIRQAAFHLNECYKNLSVNQFDAGSLKNHSRLFSSLYVALEAAVNDKTKWHVTPKLHLFQEMAEETSSCPSLTWTYRDEDMGGTLMQISRRRGGASNVGVTARTLLLKFVANNSMPFHLQ